MTLPDAPPAPYDRPPEARGVRPQPETVSLVQSQIDALLARTPSFYGLAPHEREKLRRDLTHVSSYVAELARDAWAQAKKLGQTPLVRKEVTYRPEREPAPLARTAAAQANLQTNATGRVADITQSTLRAIAFRQRLEQDQFGVIIPQLVAPIFARVTGETAAEFYPPAQPWVDPLKDTQATREAMAAGLMSRRQAVAALGYDVAALDAEIAADRAREAALGLNFGQPAATPAEDDPKEDPADEARDLHPRGRVL